MSGEDAETIRAADFQKAYTAHMLRGETYINRFLALFMRKGVLYVAMGNCLPAAKAAEGEDGWHKLYDLKGTADDKLLALRGEEVAQVHKRCWNMSWMLGECFGGCCGGEATSAGCGVPEERRRYKRGKRAAYRDVHRVSPAQRERLLGTLRADAAFMAGIELMDYSVILAVRKVPAAEAAAAAYYPQPGDMHSAPVVSIEGDEATIMYFGIIDFLQRWTPKKRTAHVIKLLFAPKPISTVPPDQYEKQFVNFFSDRIRAAEGVQALEVPTEPVEGEAPAEARRAAGEGAVISQAADTEDVLLALSTDAAAEAEGEEETFEDASETLEG